MKTTSLHRNTKKLRFSDLIVKEDEDYTIINKPPFLSSLEDRSSPIHLLSLAKEVNADYQLCHRLDKETSGVIVLAKTPEAYRNFAIQLENREVKKVYHAVLNGLHKFEDFEADEPLYVASSKSRVDFRAGKPSLTLMSTLEIFRQHSLVKCFPLTGRLHQIRAHLAFHEAPITNDPLYGGEPSYLSQLKKKFNLKKWEEERPMIDRVALHAYQIAFKDLKSNVIEVTADYPKDFAVLLKQIRKFN